jgi:hypothetical protein
MTEAPKRRPPGPVTLSPLTLALILIVLALALIAVWMVVHQKPAATVAPSEAGLPATTWPNRALTPGAIDPAVTDGAICAHDWAPGDPPQEGGDMTYSKAARHTSSHVKDAVFAEYNLTNPHDGGHSWEIDHLVPLSLGGRDVQENLWPESRTGDGLNAWAKDRLEFRLYRMVCDPPPGTQRLPLTEAQAALRTDWVAAYRKYCASEADCPAFGGD